MYTYLGYCTSSGKCAATPPECSDCNQYCQHYRSLLQSVALFSLNQTSISSFLLKFVFYPFVVFNPPPLSPGQFSNRDYHLLFFLLLFFSMHNSYFEFSSLFTILFSSFHSLLIVLPSFLAFFFPFFDFPFSPYSIFFLSAFSSFRLGFTHFLLSSNCILPLCSLFNALQNI